jgi:xanthine/uracil/vitamin C permease (AzgA family)
MRTCKECGCSEAIASFSELVELGLVRKKIPTPKHSVQFSVRQLLLATVPFALLASLVNKHGQGALVISILLLVYTAFVFLFALVVHNFDKLRGWIWDKRTPRRN